MGKKINQGKVINYKIKPQPPKKALSPFFLFKSKVYEQVKSENPGLRATELTKIISSKWNTLKEESKEQIAAEYEQNKLKQDRLIGQYEQEHGKLEKPKRKVVKR